MLTEIQSFIETYHLVHTDDRIIVGLSGGPDSVFLLHLLHSLRTHYNLTLIAAHLDHGWRAESHRDVEFCQALCTELNITFESAHINDLALPFESKGSLEEFGRKARRFFFEQLAKKHHADAIALGHHADDQQETFFIRLVRGTTLSGLVGMKPRDRLYIRPLLRTYKKDIITYLAAHSITYLTDPSNESPSFLRNRIRARVLPELKQCDARFDANFMRTLDSLSRAEETLETLTTKLLQSLTGTDGMIDLATLQTHNDYLQKRIIVAWLISHNVSFTLTEKFLDEVIRFLVQPGDKTHALGPDWNITKRHQRAAIVHT